MHAALKLAPRRMLSLLELVPLLVQETPPEGACGRCISVQCNATVCLHFLVCLTFRQQQHRRLRPLQHLLSSHTAALAHERVQKKVFCMMCELTNPLHALPGKFSRDAPPSAAESAFVCAQASCAPDASPVVVQVVDSCPACAPNQVLPSSALLFVGFG